MESGQESMRNRANVALYVQEGISDRAERHLYVQNGRADSVEGPLYDPQGQTVQSFRLCFLVIRGPPNVGWILDRSRSHSYS